MFVELMFIFSLISLVSWGLFIVFFIIGFITTKDTSFLFPKDKRFSLLNKLIIASFLLGMGGAIFSYITYIGHLAL